MAQARSERICPRCGRSSRETAFVGPLCRDCYVDVYGVAKLPASIHYVYCQYCGRYKYQGGWNEPTAPTLEGSLRDFLLMYLTRHLRPTERVDEAWIESVEPLTMVQGPGMHRFRVRVAGRAGSVMLEEDKVVDVKVDAAVCPLCTNRITKRGYNAIIQVRSSEGRLSRDMRERIEEFLARELGAVMAENLIGVEEHREGFDLLVSEPSAAKMIAAKLRSSFMAKTIETYKLVGRNPDGTRKGRLTISVRVPEIQPGDVVRVGDRLYYFLAQSRGGSPVMVDLESGEERVLDPDLMWKRGFRRYEGGLESRRYMLMSKGGDIVFLDVDRDYQVREYPEDQVSVYVDRFEEGKTYRVIVVGRRAYVVGEEEDVER